MRKTRLIFIAALLPYANVSLAVTPYHAEPITAESYSPENFGTPSSIMVTVQFANRSAVFRPSMDDESILSDAANAALITVRGRTSTPTPSAKDETLGLAWALSARKYLISHGVSPLKIAINYASAADFIADNSTPEGKLQNQRVEIELVYVMPLAQ